MGQASAIEWTDATWNPVTGCSQVSPGCAHCYAETLTERFAGTPGWIEEHRPWRPDNAAHNVRLHPDRLEQPLRWRKPRMVFVNSMSDLFHEEVFRGGPGFAAAIFAVMSIAEHHTFQVLTKRPEIARMVLRDSRFWLELNAKRLELGYPVLPGGITDDWAGGRKSIPNVWFGVSIENARFTWRADVLREIPAAVRFISAEPLLGSLFPQDSAGGRADSQARPMQPAGDAPLRDGGSADQELGMGARTRAPLSLTGIDWLIVGGESGKKARPMHPDWARQLRDASLATRRCTTCDGAGFEVQAGHDPSCDGECRRCPVPIQVDCRDCYRGENVGPRGEILGTAFFFKQWGEWAPSDQSGVRNVKMTKHRFQYESVRFTPEGLYYRANEPDNYSRPGMESLLRVGKKKAGRQLDGRTWDEMPTTGGS